MQLILMWKEVQIGSDFIGVAQVNASESINPIHNYQYQ